MALGMFVWSILGHFDHLSLFGPFCLFQMVKIGGKKKEFILSIFKPFHQSEMVKTISFILNENEHSKYLIK